MAFNKSHIRHNNIEGKEIEVEIYIINVKTVVFMLERTGYKNY